MNPTSQIFDHLQVMVSSESDILESPLMSMNPQNNQKEIIHESGAFPPFLPNEDVFKPLRDPDLLGSSGGLSGNDSISKVADYAPVQRSEQEFFTRCPINELTGADESFISDFGHAPHCQSPLSKRFFWHGVSKGGTLKSAISFSEFNGAHQPVLKDLTELAEHLIISSHAMLDEMKVTCIAIVFLLL